MFDSVYSLNVKTTYFLVAAWAAEYGPKGVRVTAI